ncbi:MAG: hypothetical protein IJO26_03955 [Clostridium sp.]|nr:hypothetical protein [Clostridium sp.]
MGQKYIYLVFSNTGTILSKCINYYTKDKYVHVSLSFDDSFEKMYSFGRIYPSNPFIGGLIQENIKDGVYKRFHNSKCIIYRIDITENQYYMLKKELKLFLKDQKKYRYNLLGLIGVIINRPIKISDNRYFCSEFVSHLLIKSNIYNTNKLPGLIKPSDLLNIDDKQFIYEGLIYNIDNTLKNSL